MYWIKVILGIYGGILHEKIGLIRGTENGLTRFLDVVKYTTSLWKYHAEVMSVSDLHLVTCFSGEPSSLRKMLKRRIYILIWILPIRPSRLCINLCPNCCQCQQKGGIVLNHWNLVETYLRVSSTTWSRTWSPRFWVWDWIVAEGFFHPKHLRSSWMITWFSWKGTQFKTQIYGHHIPHTQRI